MPMANAVAKGGLLAIGLAGALCALAVQAAGDSYVVPGSKAAHLANCVEPTDIMRRDHMELIKHQRDETVHNGIRSTKHSLAGCIDCHVGTEAEGASVGASVPVNAEGQFCNTCHRFAAVHLNCFDCHATIPTAEPASVAGHETTGAFAWHLPIGLPVPGGPPEGEGN
jgi:hypothetical protein